jgi:hypothetical protein
MNARTCILLASLILVAVACTSESSAPTAPSLPPIVVQGRPVLKVYGPKGGEVLTCSPGSCTSADLDHRTVTLASATGSQYRLGPAFFTEDQVASAATLQVPDSSTWIVQMTLDPAGAKSLEAATRDALSRRPAGRTAMIVDGRVTGAPVVQAVIDDGGPIQLSGFTQEEAQRLVAQLNS